jgi:hypothetical protein
MMPLQNGLSRRATAGVSGAAHGGIAADLGEGEVLSVDQPGGVVGGDIAGGGGSAHSPPYRDVEVVSIEHTVLVHDLPVQGAVGGAVPGPVDAMEAPEERFFKHLPQPETNTSRALPWSKITNHRSHATSYLKMMTTQDKRQHFQLKKVITATLFLAQTA